MQGSGTSGEDFRASRLNGRSTGRTFAGPSEAIAAGSQDDVRPDRLSLVSSRTQPGVHGPPIRLPEVDDEAPRGYRGVTVRDATEIYIPGLKRQLSAADQCCTDYGFKVIQRSSSTRIDSISESVSLISSVC